MANSKFIEFWSGLPPWAKGVSLVGTLGVLTVAGFKIYNSVKNKSAQQKAGGQTVDDAGQDLGKLASQGMYASYLGTQYATWADEIKTCLDYCGQDGYQTTISNIFDQMKNTADVLQLVQAFGVRTLNPCWYNHPFNTLTSYFSSSSFQGGLGWWLQNSLTQDDYDAINQGLKNKGINFTLQ